MNIQKLKESKEWRFGVIAYWTLVFITAAFFYWLLISTLF